MKNFLSFCLMLSSLLFASALADTSSCNPTTKLLHREQVYRPAIEGLAQDVHVTYPKHREHITVYILDFCVHDDDPKYFGAEPVFAYNVEDDILRFGKATIILRGKKSQGINSTVEFYGIEYK